jgi:hypothetical protein
MRSGCGSAAPYTNLAQTSLKGSANYTQKAGKASECSLAKVTQQIGRVVPGHPEESGRCVAFLWLCLSRFLAPFLRRACLGRFKEMLWTRGGPTFLDTATAITIIEPASTNLTFFAFK